MKIKSIIISALAIIVSLPTFAEKDPFKHKMSISLYTGSQTQTNQVTGLKNHSNMNFGLEYNFAQIKLHKGIIGDMLCIRFGCGFDLSYARYDKISTELNQKYKDIDWYPQQAEVGFDFGPSFHFAPIKEYKDLQLMTYYHFIPCLTAHIEDTEVFKAFGPFNSVGIGVNWKFIGIGYEHRWGSAKYDVINIEDKNAGAQKEDGKRQFDTSSNRFYLRFNL